MDLSINLTEQSYGGKKFRPTPVIDFEKSNNQLICVTPWGSEEVAPKVIDFIKNFIVMADEDADFTVAYARKETLQKKGNVLRMAVITASEKINTEFNQEEYHCGFEVFAAIQEGPQWIYVSCGQPSLVIRRENLGIFPLCQSIDLNVLSLKNQIHDPLPNQMLGLGQHPPIHFGNLRLKASDKMALISRTYLPPSFFQLGEEEFTCEKIVKTLATDQPETPFWLGFMEPNG